MNNHINDKNYIPLTPFKGWVLENFPFIEANFDAITNYELLCLIVKYLNEVISNQNQVQELGTELVTAYNQLLDYVNNYLTDENLQPLINNQLDEYVLDGTLARLINQEVFTDINNRILQNSVNIGSINDDLDNTIKTNDTDKVGMALLTQEVRTALTGGSTAVVGLNSVNSENISNNAVTVYKLDNLIKENFTIEYENVDFGDYISGNYKKVDDNAIVSGTDAYYRYYDISLENNTLYEFSGFNKYSVNALIVYDPNDSNAIVYYTSITNASNRYENVKLLFKTNKDGLKAYVNTINQTDSQYNRPEFMYLSTLSKIKEITQNKKENYIEKIRDINNYTAATPANMINNTPRLTYSAVDCKTSIFKLSKGTKYFVSSQNIYANAGLVILNEKLEVSYSSNSENVGNTPVPFTYEFTASDNGYALLQYINSTYTISSDIYIVEPTNKYKTMKWTLIGDSLTDPNVNNSVKKYYSYIQEDLGINLQNLGQSGCGYKRTADSNKNFVDQSLEVDNDADVVTIFGSFNDHNIYDTDGLGNITDTSTDTVFGCVNTTISNIINNYPNAKIGIILPTPWNNPSCNPYNPRPLDIEYIEGIKTIAKKHSIPVLDLFYESDMFPWVATFRSLFYVNSDGTHPNDAGNKRFAYQIEDFITKLI